MNSIKKNNAEIKMEIVKSIIKTKKDLCIADKNYEYADGEMIDYYLYKMKAEKSKLDYLIKKAKKEEIMLDMIEEIKMNTVLGDVI